MKTILSRKLITILLLLSAANLAGANREDVGVSCETEARDGNLMPREIGDVYLGMDLQTLIDRRSVKPFMAEEGHTAKVWLESIAGNPYYRDIVYGFSSSKDQLDSIVLTIRETRNHIKKYLPYLLKGSIAKWGGNYDVVRSEHRSSGTIYNAATLLWRLGSATVAVTFVPEQQIGEEDKSVFVIRLFCPTISIDEQLHLVDSGSNATVANDVQSMLNKLELTHESDIAVFE